MKLISILSASIIFLHVFSSCVRQEILPQEDGFTGWIAGETNNGYGTILKTGDNGLSWYRQSSVSQIPAVNMNDVSAMDQNYIWVVGNELDAYGMIMHSSDGGLTWQRQGTDSLLHNAAMLAVNARASGRVWVCGENGKLLYSDDKGSSWKLVALDSLSMTRFSGITVVQNNLWIIGNISDTSGNDSTALILHSFDGGSQFTRSSPSGLNHLNAIYALNDTVVFLTSGSSVYKSLDGGIHWNMIFTSVNGNLNDICATSEGNIWTAGAQGRAFRSTDGGTTWNINWPQSGKYTLNKISLFDTARIWICGSSAASTRRGVFYYSNNAGRTWFIGNLNVDAGINGLTFVNGKR